MSTEVRPSGASIRVAKTFATAEECAMQCGLMTSAPASVAVQPVVTGAVSCEMPLYTPEVPPEAFLDLFATYVRLWDVPTSPREYVSHEKYTEYVLARPMPAETMPGVRELFSAARVRFVSESTYVDGRGKPAMNCFTHGDAIYGNAVQTPDGPRLIDFSPRPTPGDPEIDVAKWRFSALGFDLHGDKRDEFNAALRAFLTDPPLIFRSELIRYYLCSHIVRVLSKEPPHTLGRFQFFERVLNHVAEM